MQPVVCKKCGIPQSLDDFGNDSSRPSGKYPYCKTCVKKINPANYVKHREKIRKATKLYYLNNLAKARKARKIYRDRTKEQMRAYLHIYYKNHKEELAKKNKAWRTAVSASLRIKKAQYYQKNKVRLRPMRAEITRRRRARIRQAPVIETISTAIVYTRDKGICSMCHRRVKKEEVSVDHVIPISLGGEHSYRNVTLAHNLCNARKGNRIVPQQQRLF